MINMEGLRGSTSPSVVRTIVRNALMVLLMCITCASVAAGLVFASDPHPVSIGFLNTLEAGILLIALGMLSLYVIMWLRSQR